MRGPDTIIYLAVIAGLWAGFYFGFGDPERVEASVIYGLSIGLSAAVLAWSLELQPLIVVIIGLASALLLGSVHRNYAPALPARHQRSENGRGGW